MNPRDEILGIWRLVTAPMRAMPSFVIAGAPKCGTSTLYDCIVAHPAVRRGFRKEPTSLIHYPGSRLRAAANYPLRFSPESFVVGDGSVEYFSHPDGPRNVCEVLPAARLIFLLRDPVERAWSDYQMYLKHGTDAGDFTETVGRAMKWLDDPEMAPMVDAATRHAINPVRYVHCGMYATLLERWFTHFPREQCLVIFTEDFSRCRDDVLGSVFAHLGLSAHAVQEVERARRGEYSAQMPADTARRLRAFFEPHDERLEKLLNCRLPWR